VVPPVAVIVVGTPIQVVTPEPALIVGIGFTDTCTVAVLGQPLSVPVTVYTVVEDGFAVTFEPVVADKAVAGLHVYVVAPVATRPVDEPLQIVTPEPPLTGGSGLTET
jgi:hypothetical protein